MNVHMAPSVDGWTYTTADTFREMNSLFVTGVVKKPCGVQKQGNEINNNTNNKGNDISNNTNNEGNDISDKANDNGNGKSHNHKNDDVEENCSDRDDGRDTQRNHLLSAGTRK